MNQKLCRLALLSLIIALAIGGCTKATPTLATTLESSEAVVKTPDVIRGHLEPIDYVELSFPYHGQVAEVLVAEGDQVKTGDVIARLINDENLLVEAARARQDLITAQQAYDALYDTLAFARAQALQEIADAHFTINQDQYNLNNLTIPQDQAALTAIEAAEMVRKSKLEPARQAYEACKATPTEAKCVELAKTLAAIQDEYRIAVRRLQLESEMARAEAQLATAQEKYKTLQNGPDPDQLAVAEAQLASAKAASDLAEAALASLTLVSPGDYTVAKIDLEVGKQVSPEQTVVTLADFSQWVILTDNLTENLLVKLTKGNRVIIQAEASPEIRREAIIESIDEIPQQKQGLAIYTARILLTDIPTTLRWGMTFIITPER